MAVVDAYVVPHLLLPEEWVRSLDGSTAMLVRCSCGWPDNSAQMLSRHTSSKIKAKTASSPQGIVHGTARDVLPLVKWQQSLPLVTLWLHQND
jgi:hypothetical protein